MKGILEVGQWEDSQASLVKSDGTFLAHTQTGPPPTGERLGATGDPLETRVLQEMQERNFGAVFGEGLPPDRIIGFYKVPSTNWFLVLSSPGVVILAPIVRFQLNYALLGALALLITALLLRWNTVPVAKAVGGISEASARVEQGDYSVHVDEGRSDEVGVLARSFNRMTEGLRKRELIERTFGRYMDKDVAEDLLNRPEALRLGGEKRTVTILMADLRDFTPISERLPPEQVIKIVNRHFSRMIEVIHHYRGIIVDFYGDSVLVFFDGSDSDLSERAADAVRSAVDMMAQMKPQAEENRKEDLPEISMGIGVHTGEVIVGNIGSETRTKYGIVGSAVNETHRIQAEAAPGEIMISESTYDLVKESVDVGAKCEACLKGFEGTRDLYRVVSIEGASAASPPEDPG
jgi:class 3 adenylate cyclase